MMKIGKRLKQSICYVLMLSLILSVSLPFGSALALDTADVADFWQVDNEQVSASLLNAAEESGIATTGDSGDDGGEAPTGKVRVSIVLEDESTIGAGYSISGIAENTRAMNYRRAIQNKQAVLTRTIEHNIGEKLDVQWNLTLAANLISANVDADKIAEIEATDGVKQVVVEQLHIIADESAADEATADPQMVISNGMTGMNSVWQSGYTGAGSKIAVIDTGIDTDHQSFSAEALEYAFAQTAKAKNMTLADYEESLDLLDAEKVDEVCSKLNAYSKMGSLSGSKTYYSTKIPFAFNYVDRSYEYVDHYYDSQSDHGSHVAGIAAANRYIKQGDDMVDALSTVYVAGAAPDAQLLVMKVFGSLGGAYTSDYMAAIEDAVILGADSVNLSLGTSTAGFTDAGVYQQVMDNLTKSGLVVCIAAGNQYSYVTNVQTSTLTGGTGMLYADDVMYNTVGSPGCYENSLAVASVDNNGSVNSAHFMLGSGSSSFAVGFAEDLYNYMKSMTTLNTNGTAGTEYEFVLLSGLGYDEDFSNVDVSGKIAMIPRGELAFYTKAQNAVNHGAIATVIINNEEGSIGMNLADYYEENPVVSISMADGARVKAAATKHTVGDTEYYTGKLVVHSTPKVVSGNSDTYTMSSFSSWGVPGDLTLKPEITAPGGGIYSVKAGDGEDGATDGYKLNSGTSMATPQVSGISAAVQQYIQAKGLNEVFGHNARQITQSLLMSTATPLKDKNGNYYPLLQQGAGLVNGSAAINSGSYIMMGENATKSYADGKVKAELGDDPNRKGVYEFDFTVYNTDAFAKTYELSADLFTFDVAEYASAVGSAYKTKFSRQSTKLLDSVALFMDSDSKYISSGKVTVPAKGSAKIKARLQVSDEGKAWLAENYKFGTYIQGYVFAKADSTGEGVQLSELSIPVLAFWGNWTDPSMYQGMSYSKGERVSTYSTPSTTDDSRMSYTSDYSGSNHILLKNGNSEYVLGGNPVVPDEVYMPERDAIRNGAYVVRWEYSTTRESVNRSTKIENLTTKEVYLEASDNSQDLGDYYSRSGAVVGWVQGVIMWPMNKQLPDDLAEGDVIKMTMTRLPEYYSVGKMGANSTPGSGAELSVSAVVDGVSPVVSKIERSGNKLTVTAGDNNYIAAVALFNKDGSKVLAYSGSNSSQTRGEKADFVLQPKDLADGAYLVQVYDYAMNTVTYYVDFSGDEIGYSGAMLAYNLEDKAWVQVDKYADTVPAITSTTRTYSAASAVGEKIYAIAQGSELWCLNVAEPEESKRIGDTGETIVDLAYNQKDSKLYGVTDKNKLAVINTENGKSEIVGTLPITTNTLACDADGVFYSNLYGSGKIYAYTLNALGRGDAAYDFDGNGTVNVADAKALLDKITAGEGNLPKVADMDEDGDVDTYDVYLLLDKLPGNAKPVADTGIVSKYMQAMEIDPNDGTLYWASYSTETVSTHDVGFSFLYEIDTASGEYVRYADLWDQLSALVVLDKEAGSGYGPVGGVNVADGIAAAEKALGTQNGADFAGTAEISGVARAFGVDNSQKAANAAVTTAETDNSKTVEVKITAGASGGNGLYYNGLYTIKYDSSLMTFEGCSSAAELSSIKQQIGTVTVAYVDRGGKSAGDTVATLKFKTGACGANAEITCKEEGNSHPNTTTTVDSGAHSWGEWQTVLAATCKTDGSEQRTCTKCTGVETRTVKADGISHTWGAWSSVTAAVGNTPGTEKHTCTECGKQAMRWVLPGDMAANDQKVKSGRIEINRDLVNYADVSNAGVEAVQTLTTTDGTMRYLVTLSAATALDGKFDVYVDPLVRGSSYGEGLKNKIVERVDWDGDDTDYEVQLKDGIGKLTAYSYYEHTKYVMLEIYFQVGESGTASGHKANVALPELSDSFYGRLSGVTLWNTTDIAKTYYQANDEETEIDLYIWLQDGMADDGEFMLSFTTKGLVAYLRVDGSNVSLLDNDYSGKLSNGMATVKIKLGGSVNRTYNIHIRNKMNITPEIIGGDYMAGDVNGDSVVDAKDVTLLKRYLAGWSGVTVGAAADVNNDSVVDAKDVTLLKRYLAGWSDVNLGR